MIGYDLKSVSSFYSGKTPTSFLGSMRSALRSSPDQFSLFIMLKSKHLSYGAASDPALPLQRAQKQANLLFSIGIKSGSFEPACSVMWLASMLGRLSAPFRTESRVKCCFCALQLFSELIIKVLPFLRKPRNYSTLNYIQFSFLSGSDWSLLSMLSICFVLKALLESVPEAFSSLETSPPLHRENTWVERKLYYYQAVSLAAHVYTI